MSADAPAAHTPRAYRGRLAPSPTGYLHLGHARTFWTAYERARGGTLILRDEDLDPQRSRPEFAAAMLEDLRWLGVAWQEGPDVGGPYAPYTQSARRAHYLAAWRALVAGGYVYPCVCTRRDLARAAQAPHEHAAQAHDDEPLYPGTCRPARGALPVNATEPRGVNWRFRVPDGALVEFDDLRQGAQAFRAGRDFGDFLVWRRDDVPAYQLACAVDDALMRVTEVVRGADLLKSTARQLLLLAALGHAPPVYYHCELMTDEHGQRLAKRHDALSLRALRAAGHTPAAVRARFGAT
ncbi:MAG TPA: tRNA glutamyl-Q(34) synthetase GluQRS [Pyrinomonadaceae bacterium]|jgi:glutamyl-tRNA synthetase